MASIDLAQVIRRQLWLIVLLTCAGMTFGIAYATKAQVWFESEAKVLVAQRSAGLSNSGTGTDSVDEDVLANHMGLIRSRRIVSEAMQQYGLLELPSVVEQVSESTDQIDYVMDQITIARGGSGSAKKAAIMNIKFQHTDPKDTQRILSAIMKRYEQYIVSQVEEVMGEAGKMIQDAKRSMEADLAKAEAEHLASRQKAPMFFQGEGSSNVYHDRYRRLSEELLELDIQESTLRTRLDRVRESLTEIRVGETAADHLDKLALIDRESLERLGVFAGLQVSASNSAEFKAAMPAKAEEARAQVTRLLTLNSERQRLTAVFGSGYPKVREIEAEIQLVSEFIEESKKRTTPESAFGSSAIKPDELLKAYVGFIQHDIATLGERRKELVSLTADAEKKAKELIEFELQDLVHTKKISRLESIFNGIVVQLQSLNTTSGLGGFLYEFLEVPRVGKKVWPRMPLAAGGGLLCGLIMGLLLALGNDFRDGRFRTAKEIDDALGLVNFGHVGSLASIEEGLQGLIESEGSSEAEAFRLGRTMLLPEVRSGKIRSLGFTSSMQGDGKSTIVANFAHAFAQIGLNVIVVDADLRRPSQHRYLGLAPSEGLAEVLAGTLPLAQAIQSTSIESLSVIPAGKIPPKPAELLQRSHFDKTIESLCKHYDLVLVDLPPVLAVSDPAVVLPRLDGAILVVRVARIRREQLMASLRRLRNTGANLIGSMYNIVGAKQGFDAGGDHYGEYHSDYALPKKTRGKGTVATSRSAIPTQGAATTVPDAKRTAA